MTTTVYQRGLPPSLGVAGSVVFFLTMFSLAQPNEQGYEQFRKCHRHCVNGLLHFVGMPPAVSGVFLIVRSVTDSADFTRHLQFIVMSAILYLYLGYEQNPYTPWLFYGMYMSVLEGFMYHFVYQNPKWSRLSYLFVGVSLIGSNVAGLEVIGHGFFENHHSYVLEFFNSVFQTPLYGINSVWGLVAPRPDHSCWN